VLPLCLVSFNSTTPRVQSFMISYSDLLDTSESIGEKILKIGPHLPKLLSNIKGYTFWDTVYTPSYQMFQVKEH